ncbi:MAG: GNAT family N-acetyltransferase [Eubacteriales bacterium]|nr:GNAT family N-acetyltransferase [Eubacteriales bacterium]
MKIRIRNARQNEVKKLADIEAICFPAAEAASEKEIAARFLSFPENFYVAETIDGKIAGFINGCTTDTPVLKDELYHDASLHEPDGAYQTLFGLNVLPEYRCQGIAEHLLRALMDAAEEKGKKGMILTCKEHMIHYYQKFGFQNYGVADSSHGGATWYDMQIRF